MANISLTEVTRLVAAANAARGWSDRSAQAPTPGEADAERRLEGLFAVNCTLAVYGTLAPGRPNHHVVAPLGGEWTEGVVEGDLSAEGWGAALGYPAFRPRVGGAAIAVQVLISTSRANSGVGLQRETPSETISRGLSICYRVVRLLSVTANPRRHDHGYFISR